MKFIITLSLVVFSFQAQGQIVSNDKSCGYLGVYGGR